jgi:hypothetical protein
MTMEAFLPVFLKRFVVSSNSQTNGVKEFKEWHSQGLFPIT